MKPEANITASRVPFTCPPTPPPPLPSPSCCRVFYLFISLVTRTRVHPGGGHPLAGSLMGDAPRLHLFP